MAIEQRGNGSYYYSTHRVGDKVVKIYVAGGLAGQLAAQTDAELRREHQASKAHERAELQCLSQLEVAMKDLHKQVESVVFLTLYGCGFRRHAGGEWRRQRC